MKKLPLSKITTAITNKLGNTGLKISKASPDIFIIAGVAGMVGAYILGCKEATELEEVNKEVKAALEEVHNARESLSEGEYARKLTQTYLYAGMAYAKLFGPSVALGTVSIVSILKGKSILKRRNLALMAAYKALDNKFRRVSSNMIERYGKEEYLDFLTGRHEEEVKEKLPDEETGEWTGAVAKSTLPVVDIPLDGSEYGRWFDKANSTQYDKSSIYNLAYVKGIETYMNQLLQSRGHVFLNEVYDALGFARTPEGAVAGWVVGNGDSYIDFGLTDHVWVRNKNAVDNPVDPSDIRFFDKGFWLDFNVDGLIFDKI